MNVQNKTSQKELRLHLIQAIEKDDLTTVQTLLTNEVDINCIVLFNKTPLTYAIELRSLDIAKLLVEAGAEINAREPVGNARQALHIAVDVADAEFIKFLIDRGADINGQDGCGSTPVIVASFHGRLEAVQVLSSYRANLLCQDFVGRTALHRAAEGQNENVIRFLVNNGADIDVCDKFGWTAIYHSIMFHHFNTIRVLLECGASLEGVDINNRSPLTLACNRLCPPNIKVCLSFDPYYTSKTQSHKLSYIPYLVALLPPASCLHSRSFCFLGV